jgi:hypothetical protein
MTPNFDPADWSDDDFEVIPESEVESSRLGRKPNPAAVELANRLMAVAIGQTVRVAVLAAANEDEKITNGNLIRTAAKLANLRIGIRWAPSNGVPQVTVKGVR